MFTVVLFPVWILWGSGISLRKKIALTFVFSLVWLTIAITIVRGSIFHQQYAMSHADGAPAQMQSPTFTWFWFYMEFSVAFIIACIVSFRSLFVQRAKKSTAPREEQRRREAAYRSAIRGWRARRQKLYDSVLDTCRELEGWSGSDAETLNMRGLPTVPSGLMTVDFHDDGNWQKKKKKGGGMTTSTTMTSVSTLGGDGDYRYHADVAAGRDAAHSQESLIQGLQAVHIKQSVEVVGVAR